MRIEGAKDILTATLRQTPSILGFALYVVDYDRQ